MPYDNVISRTDAAALIPEDASAEIIKRLPEASAAMSLFRSVRMARAQQRMPVMAALPMAYFVNGDTGLKQTTEAGWTNRYLNVEEIACIVPVPEAVLDDTNYDIWSETQPFMVEAVGRALDAAIFFGTNKPGTWPNAVVTDATTAGNTQTVGTTNAAGGGVAGDISALYAKVEAHGYDVSGVIASRTYRGLFRNLRATDGQPLADPTYGVPITYPLRGLWPTGSGAVNMIVGDFTEGILGVRQDLTWKLLDQAVIQNNEGEIVYNLPQQDMVAMRVVARFAWQTRGTPQVEGTSNPYPFGVMKAATS